MKCPYFAHDKKTCKKITSHRAIMIKVEKCIKITKHLKNFIQITIKEKKERKVTNKLLFFELFIIDYIIEQFNDIILDNSKT